MDLQEVAQTPQRNKAIDALRGVAAILVMMLHIAISFVHANPNFSGGASMTAFLQQFDIGRMGITIFFLISGFVIPKSIKPDQSNATKRFAIKRLFRLYPLFWFSVFAGLLFIWYLPGHAIDAPLIVANLTMIPSFFQQHFIIGLYWSLETELLFYLFIMILLSFGYLRKLQIYLFTTVFALLVILSFQYLPHSRPSLPHWTATPYHLSLMFLGVLFRHFHDRDDWKFSWQFVHLNTKNIFWSQLALVLLVPLFVLALEPLKNQGEHFPDAVAYLVGLGLFFGTMLLWKNPPQFLIFLGMISYSVYLLHPVAITIVYSSVASESLSLSVFSLTTIGLAITISTLSYYFIEKPSNKFGRRMANRFSEKDHA